ncbi:hypothetical protein L5515_002303 [Caenorhabditis briggsae]|uniref:F-box domain-containing protein n=2 Tax=Caenorhabditis briggsae TaxID=6238 RepID=A0AAE9J441_CAEBR|nr:hypothetical protein L5515_002303 [Caenorhabditis briggsae]
MSQISLSKMPDLVMKNILEKCEIRSIFSLRKVTHNFRAFIDDLSPDSRLKILEFSMDSPETISVRYTFFNGPMYLITYKKDGENCKISLNYGIKKVEKELENQDFLAIFLKDLEFLFKFQKSKMDYCSFQCSKSQKILESIVEILKSRNRLLKVKNISISVPTPENVLSILPYLASGTLETIGFSNPKIRNSLDIQKIEELDQWKNAKNLYASEHFLGGGNARKFAHFDRGAVFMRQVFADDLIFLKNSFQSSLAFKSFLLRFLEFSDEQRLIDALGQPTTQTEDGDNWWKFEYPGSDDLFTVFLTKDNIFFRHLY